MYPQNKLWWDRKTGKAVPTHTEGVEIGRAHV